MTNEHNLPAGDAAIEAEIQAKGLTAARVLPAEVADAITHEYCFTALQGARMAALDALAGHDMGMGSECVIAPHRPELGLLTLCVLVLRNGYTVVGTSACASAANYDAAIGRKIARDHAVAQIWPLLGYALRSRLADAASKDACERRCEG